MTVSPSIRATIAIGACGTQLRQSGIRSARNPYGQCRAGNVVRIVRRSEPGVSVQVFGDGPVEIVFVGPMVSHIELFWTLPEFKAFFDQLARFCRVVLFDKAGVGLSDPVPRFARWMIGQPRSRPSWTLSASERPPLRYERRRAGVHCFRGNTTGTNAGADPYGASRIRHRAGGTPIRAGRDAGAPRCRAG